jgi:hypothetical protein
MAPDRPRSSRPARFGIISICLAIAAGAAAVAAPAPAARSTPVLRVVSLQPLAVKGEAFRPRERVTVTALTLLGPRRVVVRATATGRIGATFRLPRQPCGTAFAINAVGAQGSRALVRVRSRACVPPPIR